MLELHLIRHGQSTSNVENRWQGHGDAPLSPMGREQARALGRALGGQFDAIYTSDLSRAVETAQALGGPVSPDPAWRELDVGAWEGLTAGETEARFPGALARLVEDPTVAVGGGESWQALRARVTAALAGLRTAHPQGRVAVVCHGGVIVTLSEALLSLSWRWPRPLGRVRNTARAVFAFADGDDPGAMVRYNVVDHLVPPPKLPTPLGVDGFVVPLVDPPRVADALGAPEMAERLVPCAHDLVGHLFTSDVGSTLLSWGVHPD